MAAVQSDFINTYSQMFEDMFMLNYQAAGRLRGITREIHGVVGDAYKLKVIDEVSMTQAGSQGSNIPRTNVTTTAPTITFADYQLKLTIGEFDQLNFNASALEAYSRSHARALGRREDQFVIDAGTDAAVVTQSVATNNLNLTTEKLRETRALLGANEADSEEMYLICHWNNMESLLQETEYTSAMFNMAKPLVNPDPNGEDPFVGFKIIVLGNRAGEGGLPLDGSGVRTCFAFSRDAITLAYRMDPTTRMVPVPQDARIETLSLLSAGAVVGMPKGAVRVLCQE